MSLQLNLDIHEEMLVVNFAGGGGSCTGIEHALGRRVDVAINHDPEAVAMHKANHPETRHYCESVWDVDPREVTQGRPVGLVWLSPDCKHFSKAKGGKPVEKKIRGLAWVTLRWAALRARVIMLENVEEFVTWGPLIEGADGSMRPDAKQKGREFNVFVNALRRQGYVVEWKVLKACDYGTPTIRKRLFLIARCDGQPIVWPAATHADPKVAKSKKLKPWRAASECIDFTLPCPSIFERARPLADATLRRIAKGIMRYVVNSADPFIVTAAHGEVSPSGVKRWGQGVRDIHLPLPTVTASGGYGVIAPVLTEHANASSPRCMPIDEPLRTICAQTKGGHHALIAPTMIQTGYGERDGQSPRALDLEKPIGTLVGSSKHALVSAFLAKHYTGVVGDALTNPVPTVTSVDHNSLVTAHIKRDYSQSIGHSAGAPLGTTTAGGGGKSALVTSNLVKMRGDPDTHAPRQEPTEPLHTISAQGNHFAEVRALLTAYYGVDQDPRMEDPLHTITARDRFGLVMIAGLEYQISDIGTAHKAFRRGTSSTKGASSITKPEKLSGFHSRRRPRCAWLATASARRSRPRWCSPTWRNWQ